MQKGSHRFIIQRTTEVLITVDDPSALETALQGWEGNPLHDAYADADSKEEGFLRSLAFLIERGETPHTTEGIRYKVDNQHFYLEALRTCRHCGCTQGDACHLGDEVFCHWVADDVCSNPDCVKKLQE
jgi:hypothetical protein